MNSLEQISALFLLEQVLDAGCLDDDGYCCHYCRGKAKRVGHVDWHVSHNDDCLFLDIKAFVEQTKEIARGAT